MRNHTETGASRVALVGVLAALSLIALYLSAVYADKVAVDEETVRLRSHLSQLDHMLAQEGPVGRKLDFLIQEFNREANTIGSKCNDIETAGYVVDIKAEIEKIREQIQNIE